MTTLGPGTRVKCIEAEWRIYVLGVMAQGPAVGTVWTVSALKEFLSVGITAIQLAEWTVMEDWFDASQFVPLDGNEDISVFTSMLDKLPANHKQPATVGDGL